MGNSGSRTTSVSAFLGFVCDISVRTQAGCLAVAKSNALIDINGVDNVTLRDVSITADATTSVDCSQSISVNIPNVHNQVLAAIDELTRAQQPTKDHASHVTTLKSYITESITENNLQLALVNAVADFRLTVQNRKGDVNITDFDLQSVASAYLMHSLQSMTITMTNGSQVPLTQAVAAALAGADPEPAAGCSDGFTPAVHYMSYTLLVLVVIITLLLAAKGMLFLRHG